MAAVAVHASWPPPVPAAAVRGAASADGIDLPRRVVAAGGARSSGGVYAITGTIGQPDADPLQPATGGVFALAGGFWPGIAPGTPPVDSLFGDGFEPR